MPKDSIEARLEAVERALTDGETPVANLEDAATLRSGLVETNERLDDLEERVAELEAATQAIRGYVGNVRQVNEDVERRADAALAKAEALADRVAAVETDRTDSDLDSISGGAGPSRGSASPGDTRANGEGDEPLSELLERVRESL